jgi:hypothetical protein
MWLSAKMSENNEKWIRELLKIKHKLTFKISHIFSSSSPWILQNSHQYNPIVNISQDNQNEHIFLSPQTALLRDQANNDKGQYLKASKKSGWGNRPYGKASLPTPSLFFLP